MAKTRTALHLAPKDAPTTENDNGRVHLTIPVTPGEDAGLTMAKGVLRAELGSGVAMSQLVYKNSGVEAKDLMVGLHEIGTAAASGDLTHLQKMLAIQASVLDGVFTSFAQRAGMATTNDNLERYLRLALKAQSQCRTTIESLAVIQQGPAIFARNANINNGQQQVNNGVPAPVAAPKHAEPARTPKNAKATPLAVAHAGEKKLKLAKRTIEKVAR
jgi:hypothetical protein